MRIDVMGVPFDNVTMEEALDRGMALMDAPGAACVVTPNAEIVYEAMRDPELMELLGRAELVLPDGAGVVLGAKVLGTPLKQKVAGIEFGSGIMQRLSEQGRSVYLLGGKPGVAEQAAENLQRQYPGLRIAGTHDGYFREEGPVVADINEKQPDLLLVCLGAPKQERFMDEHRDLKVGLMAGLGGSLDGYAGNVKRAPRWMINMNLEWFYRLIKEPRRIGRMMRLPKFLGRVAMKRIKG